MLIVEDMFKKSLIHITHYVNDIKSYFNFHVNNLKLLKKTKAQIIIIK
jgi:hypothetical protein